MSALVRATAVALLVIAVASEADATPRLLVSGADRGEAGAPLLLEVRVEPAGAAASLSDLRIETDAGSIEAMAPAGDDAVTFQLVPPRVAADRLVTVSARARAAGRELVVRHRVKVAAYVPPREVAESAGPLGLSGPARLVTRGDPVTLTVRATGSEPPLVRTTAGALGPPRRTGDRWTMELAAEPVDHPHVVLVVARDAEGAVDALAIPVYARATLGLRSEAHAVVAVEVGGDTWGPVRTDRSGRASLPVLVPPGVDSARTIATDQVGNVSHGRLGLGPPPFRRVLLLCPRDDNRALAFVVEPTGALGGEAPTITATPGAIERVEPLAPGRFAGHYDAPDTAAVGDQVEMRAATAASGPARLEDRCEAPLPSEPPTALRLRLSAARFRPGAAPIEVGIEPIYADNLPRRPVTVEYEVELGVVEASAEGVRWRLPNQLDGRRRATITARATDGAATGRATVALSGGPPASLTVRADRALRADGGTARFEVRATDAFGNPAGAVELQAHPRFGRVDEVRALGPGRYQITYRAPERQDPAREAVMLRAGEAEARLDFRLIPRRHRLELGARLGYLTNFAKVHGPDVSLVAGHPLTLAGQSFGVGLEVGHYRSTDRRGLDQVETHVAGTPLLARVWYERMMWPVALRAGLGAGALVSVARLSAPGAGERSIVQTGPALLAFAAADVDLGPGVLVVELGYLRSVLDHEAVRGNAGGSRWLAGYRLGFW